MKRNDGMKLTVFRMLAIVMAVFMMAGCNDTQEREVVDLKIEGKWKLAADAESSGCFSELKFLEDPTRNKAPVSVHETTGNITQIWFGVYELKGNTIQIELYEPEANAFTMTAKSSADKLKLDYKWKSEELVCSYQPE